MRSARKQLHVKLDVLQKKLCKCDYVKMAEGEGFEPSERGCRSTVFKTAAFDHSATPP